MPTLVPYTTSLSLTTPPAHLWSKLVLPMGWYSVTTCWAVQASHSASVAIAGTFAPGLNSLPTIAARAGVATSWRTKARPLERKNASAGWEKSACTML